MDKTIWAYLAAASVLCGGSFGVGYYTAAPESRIERVADAALMQHCINDNEYKKNKVKNSAPKDY